MKITILFLVFIVFAGIGYGCMKAFDNSPEVLSEKIEITPSPNSTETPTPTLTPTPTNSPTPTVTPTPTNSPTPTPSPTPIEAPNDLVPLFNEFSNLYKVDIELLKKIANCESHFNRAVDAPPYAGMYQFEVETWKKYRKLMGKDENPDLRFGARESIETASYALSLGAKNLWPACSK